MQWNHTELDYNAKVQFTEHQFSSVQFSSVAQSYSALCNPMDCSTPGLPVHLQLLELVQTHVHRVGDVIQPSHKSIKVSKYSGTEHSRASCSVAAEIWEFLSSISNCQRTFLGNHMLSLIKNCPWDRKEEVMFRCKAESRGLGEPETLHF